MNPQIQPTVSQNYSRKFYTELAEACSRDVNRDGHTLEAELTRLTDKEKEGKEETQTVLGAGEIAQPVEVFAVHG